MQVSQIKEVYVRWISIPIVSLLIAVFVKDVSESTLQHRFFVSLFFVTIFWNGAFQIFMYFRRRYPAFRQTPKRIILTILSLSVFLLLGDLIGCSVLHQCTPLDLYEKGLLFKYSPVNFICSLVIGSVYENVYFFYQWRDTIQANEALKSQQIRTQFEVLQNQMSPHFLFNSLNTLTTLISENQDCALQFTEKLSEVYRYILQNKDRELVRLEEELEFVKAYVFLLKMRYPENLHVEFSIDKKDFGTWIAPLTLQMLIENAIKHNIVSKANPLFIKVCADDSRSIIVQNNFQKKKNLEKSTKTGLFNIQKRYEYLGNQKINIISDDKRFSVAIPLIEVLEERNLNKAI